MGSHRGDAFDWGDRDLTSIARVVPDVPSFNVDDGFRYVVPEGFETLEVGTIVRVPLGGRRVRGWVTGIERGSADGLRAVLSVSGDVPVFDAKLLSVLRWASMHYVAPLAGLLPKAGPPNLPRGSRGSRTTPAIPVSRRMITGSGPWRDTIVSEAAGHLDTGGVVAVVVPTVHEVESLSAGLRETFGPNVHAVTSALPARDVTRAWREAGRPGRLVVGTRELAAWHLPLVTLAVVTEPGRRALKSKQTPTIHAWTLLRHRSRVERFSLLALGAVPPAEIAASGLTVDGRGGRPWPIVEVVDREEDGPGGVVVDRTKQAIAGVLARGGNVFVHVPRRGYAPAFRCVRCGTIRRCLVCGAGPDRGDTCRRCGAATGPCTECGSGRFQAIGAAVGRVIDDLGRSFGEDVGDAGSGARILVGTERDLPPAASMDLAVAVDPDGMWLAPNYRAEEEALRVLARIAGTVRPARGRRCLVQTSDPEHRVIAALRSGRGGELMAEIVSERGANVLPPVGDLVAVEVRGDAAAVDADLRAAVAGDAETYGPARAGEGWRWLVQGSDLHRAKVRLRAPIQAWRDRGFTVRVDADPLDL